MQIKQIAYIRSDFVEKFGIPRQSNLADTRAEIHFLPEYQNADALREIEAYDYLWLIWEFSESIRDTWSPTVRPPRLVVTDGWEFLPPVLHFARIRSDFLP